MPDPRGRLPAVHALLAEAAQAGLLQTAPRQVVVDAIRATLAAARAAHREAPSDGWVAEVARRLAAQERMSLTRVVNATGVVLHTNLGRAPLARSARAALERAAGYSTLEYDADAGERGSRQVHVRALLTQVTGAQDGIVVTNAAAALLLVVNTLADQGETIVSRGELVEIGDGFRLPEIIRKSGSVLVEVGTTNRTRLLDYQRAISPRTRAVLKVHRSNFRLEGFTSEATVAELVGAMGAREIPVVHDVGSGLLVSLEPHGLSGEPLVQDSVAAGALVVFSGDKLLGGPQAGIIVGPAELVAGVARNPLYRALRPDKSTIAALEATLAHYRDPASALQEIPALAMLTIDAATLKRRAGRLRKRLGAGALIPGSSSVGGGAFPGAELPTTLIALEPSSCDAFLAALRRHDPPVIARAHEGKVVLDVRTIADDEFDIVADAASQASSPENGSPQRTQR
ncbi:MAG: L-seryl-tRNA(Sec) selenium transferase [Gemmatimonadetes bacterium]|nr:L-seryl-tRNA(Sec) selenium transferase [Gemmatimonadota bacterium]